MDFIAVYNAVNQDFEIYSYYPSGFIEAFTKIGGLLALLNIGIALNFIHKRWFDKEIEQIIAQSKITPVKDKEEEEKGNKTET
jgi:hypothetical protein